MLLAMTIIIHLPKFDTENSNLFDASLGCTAQALGTAGRLGCGLPVSQADRANISDSDDHSCKLDAGFPQN